MTLIEFFDKSPLHNVSFTLAYPVNTVYYFGTNNRKMSEETSKYKKLFANHGRNVNIKTVCVPKYDMDFAVNELCRIIDAEKDVVIDVSGGTDCLLAAAGVAFEKCRTKGASLSHFSFRSGRLAVLGNSGVTSQNAQRIKLTCDEVVELQGGKIVYSDEKKSGTVKWNFNKDSFRDDVEKMWDICKRDNRTWNRSCARLGELENFAHNLDGSKYEVRLDVEVPKAYACTKNKNQLVSELTPHLDRLSKAGLIYRYTNDEHTLRFRFKNEQVRQCLLKAGNALELITYLAATEACNEKGIPVYNDTLSGVVLDWDGSVELKNDTENEIDGLFIKGMIPVFVSCKNGGVDENELYKLNSVAEHFGTGYAKKVLVATDLQKNYSSLLFFKKRADEMGIVIIDGVHRMSFGQLCKKLSSL